MNRKLIFTLGTVILPLATAVNAQEMGPAMDTPVQKPVEFNLGIGLTDRPAYLGSDDRKSRAVPMFTARWSNGLYAGTTGIGFQFPSQGAFTGGLGIGFDMGRKAEDSPDLLGMGDIKSRATMNAFANYRLQQSLSLVSKLSYGSGNDKSGAQLDLGLRSVIPLGGSHRLFGGAGLSFVNSSAMRSQFGVTADQSITSGYATYTPGGGLRDLHFNLGYSYSINPETALQLSLGVRSLRGDAKDSPLVRSGTGTSVNIGLVYKM